MHWATTGLVPGLLRLKTPGYRFARVIEAVRRLTEIQSKDRWLDLGCHQGQFLSILTACFDVSGSGIDAWDPHDKSSGNWRYLQGDIERPIQLDERFNFVSALEVLEHMTDTDAFLDECNRLLEPRGYLLLSTPNINSLRNRITVPLGRYPTGLEYRNVIHHVRLYNVDTLCSHLKEHGFVPEIVWGVSMLPQRLLNRTFLRRASESLGQLFPHLAGNLIVIAQKLPGQKASVQTT
jgi:SAM-dependent methyltransferase